MKRLAGLCRVSTDRQKDEHTIEVQKRLIEEWAIENDSTIVDWYCDDGWSGDILARPDLDRLRDDANKDLWDTAICVDRDRIARKLSYQELIIDELQEHQKEIIIISDPLATTGEGRVMQQIKGVFAEYEKIKIVERMRRGKMNKAKSGKLVGYNPPYGYRYIPKIGTQECHFEIYEPEAEVVRTMFRWVADQGYSLRRVVKELYDQNILPPKEQSAYWVKSSVERVIKRQDYYGVSHYNRHVAVVPKTPQKVGGYKKIKKSSHKLKPEEEWIEVPVPAIIDKELYDRAQEALKANVIYNVRNKIYAYLLSGKVHCMCGIKRVGDGVNGHHYYRCAQRIYKYPLPSRCTFEGVNATILDTMVWSKLAALLSDPNLVKAQLDKWTKKHDKRTQKSHEDQKQLQTALQRLKGEEANYLKAYGEKIIDFEQFKSSMQGVKAKKDFLVSKSQQDGQTEDENTLDLGSLEEICDTITEVLKEAPVTDKQVYMRKLITTVIVGERRRAYVKGRIPIHVAPENILDVLKNRDRWIAECW